MITPQPLEHIRFTLSGSSLAILLPSYSSHVASYLQRLFPRIRLFTEKLDWSWLTEDPSQELPLN